MPPKPRGKAAAVQDGSGNDSAGEDPLNETIRSTDPPSAEQHSQSTSIEVRLGEMMLQIQNLRAEVEKSNLISAQASTVSANSGIDENNVTLAAALSELSRTLATPRQEHGRKLYDLPEFDGTPEVWPRFKETYTMTAREYHYDDCQNMLRLQKALKGRAYEAVESLLIHSSNVPMVIKSLEEKFGRPDQLVISQIAKVRCFGPIPENNLDQIIPFATKVQNLASFLEAAGAKQHLANPTLMCELLQKLPAQRQIDWVRHSKTIEEPTVKHFSEWLQELAGVVNTICINYNQPKQKDSRSGGQSRFFYADVADVADGTQQVQRCIMCSEKHDISHCERFIGMDQKLRWRFARKKRLCFNCLNGRHRSSSCDQRHKCNNRNCTLKLHGLLHHVEGQKITDGKSDASQQQRHVFTNKVVHPQSTDLLFKILPVKLFANGIDVDCYALLDEGSSVSLINENLVDRLGLRGKTESLKLQWFGDKTVTEKSSRVDMEISGVGENSRKFSFKGVRTVKDLRLPTQTLNISELQMRYRHMKKLSALSYEAATPELLIGLDNAHLGVAKRTTADGWKGPAVVLTKLGWVVYGSGRDRGMEHNHTFFARADNKEEEDLELLVRNHIANEDLGVSMVKKEVEPQELNRAKRLLEETTVRKGLCFETGLLWKHDNVVLPDSREMAMKRLLSLEKRLQRDREFREEYVRTLNDYEYKGYARKLSANEISVKNNRTWYIPHFGVYNPNKPGKLRLVFDAAADIDGTSLNSVLLTGPDLCAPLATVLMKFRQKPIAICADIVQMFHQVRIRMEDQASQRFLWRKDYREPIQEYAMTVMTFGAKCSPCSAQFVKNRNAADFQEEFPEAVAAIINNHYVDDYVHCFSNESEAMRVTEQVVWIHAQGGFDLKRFVSNSTQINEKFNQSEPQPSVLSLDKDDVECNQKVLGMYWETKEDQLKFVLAFGKVDHALLKGERKPTKREVLRITMSVFDPFGIAAEYTLMAKLLLQLTWQKRIEWDEIIPEEATKTWTKWLDMLQEVRQISIPRCYGAAFSVKPMELHIFTDASEMAYATVAYWRIPGANKNQMNLAFVLGKTKCAPLKITSIPRLELQSAVLGARIRSLILASHDFIPVRVIMWSDSKTVLSWIKSDHRRYKPYVAHRVNEILETTKLTDWRWLPSALNPADFGTRMKDRKRESFWVSGPKFLLQDEASWPNAVPYQATNEELRPRLPLLHIHVDCDIFNKFSSFTRLKRTIAWMLRFRNNGLSKRRNTERRYGSLTLKELESAEQTIVRRVQEEVYPEEYQCLKMNGQLQSSSRLWKLTPCMDEAGVIRLDGRISRAMAIPPSSRRPIILPKDHRVTELVIDLYHSHWKHQNQETIIAELRRRYWIPNIRAAVRYAAKRCQVCKNGRVMPAVPQMGQLPEDRLTPYVRPFTYVGLDYMGPFSIVIGRRSEKRWIALFTCMTTRAIHLEIAKDLSTDTCLMCIRNFMNRRGIPVRIRSDNGTNFVGADNELKRQQIDFEHDKISDVLASKNIEWIFNCPLNPHAGGCWERLVRSVKRAMGHAVHSESLQEHSLYSLMCEAENIVNSRPLTHIPLDTHASEPLTPNHFLLGTANSEQTPHPHEEKLRATRKQWRKVQQMQQRFWKKWIAEYLPDLCRRTKWYQPVAPLSIDDVVLICDSAIQRSKWPMGIVVRTFPGRDSQVRSAEVRTKAGIIKRPACMLAKLDVGESGMSEIHGVRDVVSI